jgi:hypothetical protein
MEASYRISTPQNFPTLFISHPLAYEDGTDSIPKRRLLNIIRRRTTQKVTHNTFF